MSISTTLLQNSRHEFDFDVVSRVCRMVELRLSSAFEANGSIIPDETLSECEALVERAKSASPTNFEPLQVTFSIWMRMNCLLFFCKRKAQVGKHSSCTGKFKSTDALPRCKHGAFF